MCCKHLAVCASRGRIWKLSMKIDNNSYLLLLYFLKRNLIKIIYVKLQNQYLESISHILIKV